MLVAPASRRMARAKLRILYLKSTSDRQRSLADAVAAQVRAELGIDPRGRSVARPGSGLAE